MYVLPCPVHHQVAHSQESVHHLSSKKGPCLQRSQPVQSIVTYLLVLLPYSTVRQRHLFQLRRDFTNKLTSSLSWTFSSLSSNCSAHSNNTLPPNNSSDMLTV